MLRTQDGELIGTRLETRTGPVYLPARQVWERYGVTPMTIHRWIRDPRMDFPAPVYLGRFRYWRLEDLEGWERRRAAASAAA